MSEPTSAAGLRARFAVALERLAACAEFARIIPEVRTNLVYAAERARDPRDVLAVEGRITVVGGLPHPSGPPVFGASDHMARLVIELGRREPAIRAGINFASNPQFDRWLADYATGQGWVASIIDRSREPAELEREELPSIPWKVEEAIRAARGRIPKVFYETAAHGKEPLTFLVGPDPVAVVDDACAVARAWTAAMGAAYITRWSQPESPPGG